MAGVIPQLYSQVEKKTSWKWVVEVMFTSNQTFNSSSLLQRNLRHMNGNSCYKKPLYILSPFIFALSAVLSHK